MYDIEGLLKARYPHKRALQKRILTLFSLASQRDKIDTFLEQFKDNFSFIMEKIMPLVIYGLESDIDEILMLNLEYAEKTKNEGVYLRMALTVKKQKDDFNFIKSQLEL